MATNVRRDIHTARMMSYLGLLGIIVPLLGWIFGGIAISKIGYVLSEEVDWTNDLVNQLSIARVQAWVVVVMSTVTALLWGFYYYYSLN